jgi:hypothetical protein
MKKFLLKTILIALLAWAAQYVTVWFAGPLVAMLVNLIWKGESAQGFFSGFVGVGLLWLLLATYSDMSTEGILSAKMAQILPLDGSRTALVFLTGLIGGFAAGLCGWTGSLARKLTD